MFCPARFPPSDCPPALLSQVLIRKLPSPCTRSPRVIENAFGKLCCKRDYLTISPDKQKFLQKCGRLPVPDQRNPSFSAFSSLWDTVAKEDREALLCYAVRLRIPPLKSMWMWELGVTESCPCTRSGEWAGKHP